MGQPVPGAGDHRLESPNQLVLALGSGVESLEPGVDRLVDALIEAGLEMQPVEFRQAAPVAAVEGIAALQ
ncbi:hypothetical protein D3C72_2460190 [compost metagenome]